MRISRPILIGSGTLVVLVAALFLVGRLGVPPDRTRISASPTLDPDPRAIRPGAEVRARGTVAAIRNGPMCIAYSDGDARLLGKPEPNDPPCSTRARPG